MKLFSEYDKESVLDISSLERWIHCYMRQKHVVVHGVDFRSQHQTNAPSKHGTYVTYEVHVKSSIFSLGVIYLDKLLVHVADGYWMSTND